MPSLKHRLRIGIDPGWKSLGWGVTLDGDYLSSGHLIPEKLGSYSEAAKETALEIFECTQKLSSDVVVNMTVDVAMERFVAYQGITTSASEDILMFMGGLTYCLEQEMDSHRIRVKLVRAIDWKPVICKYLVRSQKFSNPSSSFDKKFSLAAAEALSKMKIKSDHEADAICLAYLHQALDYEQERQASKKKGNA